MIFSEGKIHFEHFKRLSFFPSQGHNSVKINIQDHFWKLENKSFHLAPFVLKLDKKYFGKSSN